MFYKHKNYIINIINKTKINILQKIILFLFILFLSTYYSFLKIANSSETNFGMHFNWPCINHCKIVDDFDKNLPKYSAGNRGIDLSMKDGENVYCPYDGEIFYSGKIDGKNIISIKHINNIRTTYVGATSLYKKGDKVLKGEIIGSINFSNMKMKALHFGVILNKDTYLDTKIFLFQKIILLPIIKW